MGSFTCTCKSGYTGDGTTCTDIGECAENSDNCDVNAVCTNTDGGFTCSCNSGYAGDGTTCTDVDECVANSDNCDDNAACTNTDGGFTCASDSGYSGDGNSCTDDDECTDNTDDCHTDATCTNTAGGFTCTCPSGYTGDGINSCSDTDECSLQTHNCDANAECTNTIGGFTCACSYTYKGDGTSCSPWRLAYIVLAEQEAAADNCSPNCFRNPRLINGEDGNPNVNPPNSDNMGFQQNGFSIYGSCMVIYENRPIIYGGQNGIDNQILEIVSCGLSSLGTLSFTFNSGLCAVTQSKVTKKLSSGNYQSSVRCGFLVKEHF